MPTYDYQCDNCDHKFENFQSMTSPVLKKCPKCGKSKLRRLIGTGAGIIFKGSGFYCTDYRGDSYRQAAKNDKSASSGGESKSETKAESKPAETKSSDTAASAKHETKAHSKTKK